MTTQEMKRELILALQQLQRREDFRQLNMIKPMGGGAHRGGMRAMLVVLSQADKPMTNLEVAEALDIRPSSVTQQVAMAESKGLLTRLEDPNDRRRKRIEITEKGLEFVGGRREKQEAIIDSFFANLSPNDIDHLLDLVTKINETPDIPRLMPRHKGGKGPRRPDRIEEQERNMDEYARRMRERARMGNGPFPKLSEEMKAEISKDIMAKTSHAEGYADLRGIAMKHHVGPHTIGKLVHELLHKGYITEDPQHPRRFDSTAEGRKAYNL
jgi:DNA-binding MarR family transcriptional regulator